MRIFRWRLHALDRPYDGSGRAPCIEVAWYWRGPLAEGGTQWRTRTRTHMSATRASTDVRPRRPTGPARRRLAAHGTTDLRAVPPGEHRGRVTGPGTAR